MMQVGRDTNNRFNALLRRLAVVLLAIGLIAALAACGGDSEESGSDDGDSAALPAIDGAEAFATREPDEDTLSGFGFDASNWSGTVYRTEKPMDEVTTFYTDGIEDDGWDIAVSTPILNAQTIMTSKDDHVAMLTIMTGADAKVAALGGLDEFDVNLDEVADDEVLIVVTEFTCEEDDVEACVSLGL